jgi:ABC-type uncharacterized transport system substrate-binding protein
MKRRTFITLMGAAAAWPLVARAQKRGMPMIGFLNRASPGRDQGRAVAFRRGLSQAGYVEGQNVAIQYRWGDGQRELLTAMAGDLARDQVSVIAAGSDSAALAAKAVTNTIPIVFAGGNDPVKLGLVASLNRPGGNVTGVVNLNIELGPKRLDLLHELVPSVQTVSILVNPTNPSANVIAQDLQAAAQALGVTSHVLHASSERDIEIAFVKLKDMQAGALVIGADVFLTTRSEQLASLTIRHALPAISQAREFAVAGGLASYGTDIREQYRLFGLYTGRVLMGERPAELPVQQATKLELVLNLNTARAFGITVPLPLSGRADEVIE